MEKPKCKLIGENGNIFNLMGIVSKTLKDYGMIKEADEMYQKITKEASNYDEALCIIMEYVDVYWVREVKYMGLEFGIQSRCKGKAYENMIWDLEAI